MSRRRRRLGVLVAAALTAGVAVSPLLQSATPSAATTSGAGAYLALGDSIAFGLVAVPFKPGYVQLLAARLAAEDGTVRGKASPGSGPPVTNLAAPGATTRDLLAKQLGPALAQITRAASDRDPGNDVQLVTVTVGANDALGPVLRNCLPVRARSGCQAVTEYALERVRTNLTDILSQLTAAAPDADVVVTTYYNPLASCPAALLRTSAPALADAVLEGGRTSGLSVDEGLNDVIRSAAATSGAHVADLYGALGRDELVGDCLHPNPAGHRTIAGIVYAAVLQAESEV